MEKKIKLANIEQVREYQKKNGETAYKYMAHQEHWDKEKNKYRAEMSFAGETIRLGRFDTVESAFARYKEYKEDFIKDMAEQYKDEIPDKVYQAMQNWVVEITD